MLLRFFPTWMPGKKLIAKVSQIKNGIVTFNFWMLYVLPVKAIKFALARKSLSFQEIACSELGTTVIFNVNLLLNSVVLWSIPSKNTFSTIANKID